MEKDTVDLLHVQGITPYTIPNFKVITVQLRHVVVGFWDEELGKLKHYDAFLHQSEVIPEAPATIEIVELQY